MNAAVSAVSRFTLIGAAILAVYIGYREWTKAREAEERRQAYEESCSVKRRPTRRRLPPQPSDECPICLDNYFSPIEILPCGHIFHKKCIRLWFQQRRICPVCKASLSPDDKDEYMKRLSI